MSTWSAIFWGAIGGIGALLIKEVALMLGKAAKKYSLPREPSSHPEAFCGRCGRPNVTWFAPSEVWNRAVPQGGILCPVCFVQAAEKAGIRPPAWEVRPEILGKLVQKFVVEPEHD